MYPSIVECWLALAGRAVSLALYAVQPRGRWQRCRGNKIEVNSVLSPSKGRWLDNVFVERLSRSAKSEEVYLRAHDDMATARHSLGLYFAFYNG